MTLDRNGNDKTQTVTRTLSVNTTAADMSPRNVSEHNALVDAYRVLVESKGIRFPVAYEFHGELGRGRQGRVFLAKRRGARGCVTSHAIKVYDPGIYASSEQYWEDMGRVASQISALHSMHNPNLLARDIYEEMNGVGYVQMEEIDGIDLTYLLDNARVQAVLKSMPSDESSRFLSTTFHLVKGRICIQPGIAVYIMRQILRGLEALHSKDFVHCDIKPSNVMIDRLGYTRLIDHGRAARNGEAVRILLGSLGYMAPEAHRREASVKQSDLYAVGLVGLEMLRGVTLITDTETSEDAILAIKKDLPNRIDSLLPGYVRENQILRELLHGLLATDIKDRSAEAQSVESGYEGLSTIHRQLVQIGKDTEYDRELQDFMAYLVDPVTNRIRRP